MALSEKIWPDLDRLLQKGKIPEAIRFLEEQMPKTQNSEEIALLARRLAHLYRSESRAKSSLRAAQFAHLAGEAYCSLGRFGPAMAILNLLTQIDTSGKWSEKLKMRISQVFSLPQAPAKGKKADDNLPPPTPYQEMQALVSFEREEEDWLREQWSVIPRKPAPLLSWLKPAEVYQLVHLAVMRELPAGATLFREGDTANAFYIIAEGEMLLSTESGLTKVFKEGECFGEIALFGRMPRTATFRSVQGTKLLEFSEDVMRVCFEKNAQLRAKVNHFYELRLFLYSAAHHPLFEGITQADLENLWDQMTSLHLPSGRVLFDHESPRDRFYMVTQGEVHGFAGDRKVIAWTPGQFVGPSRSLDKIMAATECQVLECHRTVFEDLQKVFPSLNKAFDPNIPFDFLEDEVTRKTILN